MIQVTNQSGITFNVRLVRKGERYGLNDCLKHNEEHSLVEFYDSRFTEGFGERGQFVSRYYVSTFMDIKGNGLCFHGGLFPSKWSITDENVKTVQKWLQGN